MTTGYVHARSFACVRDFFFSSAPSDDGRRRGPLCSSLPDRPQALFFCTKDHHNRCWVELQTEGAQASARHGLCFPGFQDRLRARLNPKTRARRSLPCPKRFINTITLRSLPPHHHQLGSIRVGDFTGILKWILYPDVQRFSLHKAWLFCNSDRH
jgi:hypothetical protein